MKNRRFKKLSLFLFLLLSSLILASSAVYAPISVHPAGCSYGDTSCGANIASCEIDVCLEDAGSCPTICTADLQSCEHEGRYDVTFWVHGDAVSRYAYTVNYDDNEEFCQEPDCGNGWWNEDADSGKGECCGDDQGILLDGWNVVVTIDEENIPAFHEIQASEKVNFGYASTSPQKESIDFEVPKQQMVSWRFIIKGCWLYNTEIYAMIKDSSGAPVAGKDGNYIFEMGSDEQCTGNYVESGTFEAVDDETYTLEIYKGDTDVASDEGLGFEDMSLEVTFIDYSDETRTDTVKFVQKINSNSTRTFNLVPKSNGTLNKNSIKRYIVPGSSAYISDITTTVVKSGEHIEDKITAVVIDYGNGGDCAIVYSGDICFDTYNYEYAGQGISYWDWLDAGDRGLQGGIIDIECYGVTAVSDGWNWHLCKYPNSLTENGSISQPVTSPLNRYIEFSEPRLHVGGHHFLCYNDGIRPRIAECVGETEQPLSSISASYSPGSEFKTGESIETAGVTYYCTTYSALQTDLDNVDDFGDTEGKSCTEVKLADGESLKWTGSLCCGEADDGEEYYNDIGGNGGCWKSVRMPKEALIEEDGREIKEVINYNGGFLGCEIAANAQYTGKGYLLEIQDLHAQKQLITDKKACTILTNALGGNAYCNYWGEWKETQESNLSLRTNPFTGGSGCCPPGKCWDGTPECANNQIDDPDTNTFEGYRCYDGEWVEVQLKESWDKETLGFCPRDEQCLVTMDGSAGNNDNPEAFYTDILTSKPKCVADKDYFLDSYCEKGKWTSRTKQIASAMIDMANKKGLDYTLYCDDYENVLPEYKDILAAQCSREGYNVPCINNICMLTYGNNIIIGTSYNVPINSGDLANNPLAGLCQDAKGDEEENPSGKFVACTRKTGSSSEVWYNQNIESIIFNKGALIDVSLSDENWFDLFVPLLKGAMDAVLDWIIGWNPQTLAYGEPHYMVVGLINGTQDFDRIYISHVGSKHVIATYGKAIDYDLPLAANPQNFIALTYEGFETGDLCQYARRFQNDYGESVACNKSGNNYYIFSRYDIWMEIWQDLTSKLRLNADTVDTCADECTIFGIKECGAGMEYRECGQYDPDSCIEWSQYLPLDCSDYCDSDTKTIYYDGVCSGGGCSYSTQACQFGCLGDACRPCEDECPYYSAKNCIDDTHYEMCLNHDDDDCFEWGGSYELLCPDYCSDTQCFKQGSCSIGQCHYEQVISCVCDKTCNSGCDSDPDCSCTDEDGCCGLGCYAHNDDDCLDVNPCIIDDAALPCLLDY